MLSIIMELDQLVLDTVEGMSHKVQREFGLTCFGQARVILGLSISIFIMQISFDVVWNNLDINDAAMIIVLISQFRSFTDVKKWEVFDKVFQENNLKNPGRYMEAAVMARICLLTFLIFFEGTSFWHSVLSASDIALVLIALHAYLISSTPLPPCKGKWRRFLKLPRMIAPIPAPAVPCGEGGI